MKCNFSSDARSSCVHTGTRALAYSFPTVSKQAVSGMKTCHYPIPYVFIVRIVLFWVRLLIKWMLNINSLNMQNTRLSRVDWLWMHTSSVHSQDVCMGSKCSYGDPNGDPISRCQQVWIVFNNEAIFSFCSSSICFSFSSFINETIVWIAFKVGFLELWRN